MSMPTITVDRAGEKIAISPRSFLGDAFQNYLGVLRQTGARFDPKTKRHLAEPSKFDDIYHAMVRAGFTVENTDTVVQLLVGKKRVADEVAAQVSRRAEGKGLFPYQISGATWLAKRDRALLADDMGLGKTVQALMAIPENSGVVVVCPAAVKGVWRNECARWRPDLTPVILSGRKSWRWPSSGELVIVNYDILPSSTEGARNVVLIADEAHALKNYKAARTEKFKDLATAIKKAGGRTWLLTGTPLLGKPFDLWGVLGAASLGWDAYGSWDGFLAAFGMRKEKYGYSDPRPTAKAAEGLQRVCLRRRKIDVLPDLPKKTHQDLFVDVESKGEASTEVKAQIRKLGYTFEQEWSDADGEIVTQSLPIELISKLRQEIAVAKIPAMFEVIEEFEEAEEPLVVFSAHRAPILDIANRKGWAVITGDTSPEDRAEIVRIFQAGELKGVGATIAAGGVGLTLTHASNLLMVDLDWTPALNVQAEDRVCRIGQTRPVLIKRLVSDHPVDRSLQKVLVKKIELIRATIEKATETDQSAIPATAIDRAVEIAKAAPTVDPPKPREVLRLDLGTLPESFYAVGDPTHFFKVSRPTEGEHAGRSFLWQQMGDERVLLGSIERDGEIRTRNGSTDTGVRNVLQRILFDPKSAAIRYGQEIGVCADCGRQLTNEESRKAGIGPVCAHKWGN
jgi:SWI/SNF-related matrix-associated actin-dependent regulator 1 of chromatin subfamily A